MTSLTLEQRIADLRYLGADARIEGDDIIIKGTSWVEVPKISEDIT